MERFKKFKDAFDKWMKEELISLISELQEKVEEYDTTEIANFILEWMERQMIVEEIIDEYDKLDTTMKWIIMIFGISAVTGFFLYVLSRTI